MRSAGSKDAGKRQRPFASIVVPVYNYAAHLEKTLASIMEQSFRDFELIVVDDCSSDRSAEVAGKYTKKIHVNRTNSGPAASRNRGVEMAKGRIVCFIDSDCIASRNWLEEMVKCLGSNDRDCAMGRTSIPESNLLGDAISCLGFPGGANAGFENMWKVDRMGFTDHITSCNFAAKREAFRKFGGFDESFPLAGGEDSELSLRWSGRGARIFYNPGAEVFHEPRKSLVSFSRWMFYRGRSNYHFKQKAGSVAGFVKLRLWSSMNIIRKFIVDPKIVLIVPLLTLSFLLQQLGYFYESLRTRKRKAE